MLDKLHHLHYTLLMDAIPSTSTHTTQHPAQETGGRVLRFPSTSDPRSTSATGKQQSTSLHSSWIASIAYHRTDAHGGILVVFLKSGEALLHGPNVPAHIPGLLTAGRVGDAATGHLVGGCESVGRAYNRLVRGKYQAQRVGREEAAELRRMLEAVR